MKIEEGKFYRTRAGRKVGPVYLTGDSKFPFRAGSLTFTENGLWYPNGGEDEDDLVAPYDAAHDSMQSYFAAIEAKRLRGDAVNHPSHYTTGGIECFDAMRAMLTDEEMIGYLRGNSFKYRWRFRHKNGAEDLRKAEWYERKLSEIIDKTA